MKNEIVLTKSEKDDIILVAKNRLKTRNFRFYCKKATRYLKCKSGCFVCGNEFSSKKLHFHHKDKKTKLFEIGHIPNTINAWKTVLDEIKKCTVLCGSCHARIHCLLNEEL